MDRTTVFDLIGSDENCQAVLGSIRRYRHACREMYGVLLAAFAAGAEIVDEEKLSLKPDNDRATVVLAAAMGRVAITKESGDKGEGNRFSLSAGKALGYEMRTWFLQDLCPGFMSFVWDSAKRDVTTVWTSGDPEFPKAKRGWLALQGARGIAQFQRRGIGFPLATGRPALGGYTLHLKWDHNLGEQEFKLPRLDGGRRHVWLSLRDKDEGWKLGTIWLNERDGKLLAIVSHHRPERGAEVDAGRICRLSFGTTAETWLTVASPDGEQMFFAISAADAIGHLAQNERRRIALEARKAAVGNPCRPWGRRKGWDAIVAVLGRNTANRARFAADCNHAWTRRIVGLAVSWRCGQIMVPSLPETMHGYSWPWSDWTAKLRYKAEERGIAITDSQ